jgi:hypothetical protein
LNGLDPIFGGLAIEGIGLSDGFLRFDRIPGSLPCPFQDPDLAILWTKGFGRSLWFVYHNRTDLIADHLKRIEARLQLEILAGFGLAQAFINS